LIEIHASPERHKEEVIQAITKFGFREMLRNPSIARDVYGFVREGIA
jgi:hypothetical protein